MIDVFKLCELISARRDDALVVACQTARRPWYEHSKAPELDILFRGSMGKGSSLGLGLALARPERRVIVLDGDGSLLMNLGSLATIVDAAPRNLTLFVLQNGVYAGTGRQEIPAANRIAFAQIASGAGFNWSEEFADIARLRDRIDAAMTFDGPSFVSLLTQCVPGGEIVKDNLPRLHAGLRDMRRYLSPSK